MVNISRENTGLVKRCFNTLIKEVDVPSDMDNSHMLSIIEQKMCVDDRKVWSGELERDRKKATLQGLIDWMNVEMKSRMRATAPLRTASSTRSVNHFLKDESSKRQRNMAQMLHVSKLSPLARPMSEVRSSQRRRTTQDGQTESRVLRMP